MSEPATLPIPRATADSGAPSMPCGSLCERMMMGILAAMPHGRLRLELPGGVVRGFGAKTGASAEVAPGVSDTAFIQVRRRRAFFSRCILSGDIGFAESYMDGDWDTPDLTAVVGWFLLNLEHAPLLSGSGRGTPFALNLLRFVHRARHRLRTNTRGNARRNIAAHYDLSNDFFALWLDPSMMYSAAMWSGASNLEEAQAAKNEALCRKLRIGPDSHVLEIGTGWGGWSLHAARHHGCRVTTVTISRRQAEFARKRIAGAGLSGRVEVRLQDYRDIAGSFDRIVSIEMLEAVGHRHLPRFASACHRLLRPDGLMALQFITCPDARYDSFRRGVDFVQKHIFPGSLLLSANRLNDQLARHGGFMLHGHEDFGPDYARTLQEWRLRFRAELDRVRGLGFDDRFIRKWDYYLCYCEAAFAMRNISVVQTVHTRPNNLAL